MICSGCSCPILKGKNNFLIFSTRHLSVVAAPVLKGKNNWDNDGN